MKWQITIFEQLKLENNHEAFPDQFDIYSYEVFTPVSFTPARYLGFI